MRPLNKTISKILDTLTAGMSDDNGHRKLDHAPGVHLPAAIEKIGPTRYSVAHYFEQNGDLVADPDLEFVRQENGWFPVAITQILGSSCPVETDENHKIIKWDSAGYNDLRRFAGMMLKNIKAQQGSLTP